jgi:hypothetical protein
MLHSMFHLQANLRNKFSVMTANHGLTYSRRRVAVSAITLGLACLFSRPAGSLPASILRR